MILLPPVTQATSKNVAHISYSVYNSYIPPWGVVLHIGVATSDTNV